MGLAGAVNLNTLLNPSFGNPQRKEDLYISASPVRKIPPLTGRPLERDQVATLLAVSSFQKKKKQIKKKKRGFVCYVIILWTLPPEGIRREVRLHSCSCRGSWGIHDKRRLMTSPVVGSDQPSGEKKDWAGNRDCLPSIQILFSGNWCHAAVMEKKAWGGGVSLKHWPQYVVYL